MRCTCGACLRCRRRAAARAARAAYAASPRGRAAREALKERGKQARKAERERAKAAARARPSSKKHGTQKARIPTLAGVPRETRRKLARAWARSNPEKRAAHAAVRAAVKSGALVRQPCERCGARRVQAHHDDYAAPLSVRWLCGPCHRAHHAAERLTLGELVTGWLSVFLGARGDGPRGCTAAPAPRKNRVLSRNLSAAGGVVAVGPRAHEVARSAPISSLGALSRGRR